MKAAPLIYTPLSIFTNWFKKDLSDIDGVKANRAIVIIRYLLPFILAWVALSYPLVYYPFVFEDGMQAHFRGEAFLAGNLDVGGTIVRCVLVYGYGLFLALIFYAKKWYWKTLHVALFAFYIYMSAVDHSSINVFLSVRAGLAWYILLYTVADFLNKNYKNLKYNSKYQIVFLPEENNNVSIWRVMFFSSVIIAIELWITIALLYSEGGAI